MLNEAATSAKSPFKTIPQVLTPYRRSLWTDKSRARAPKPNQNQAKKKKKGTPCFSACLFRSELIKRLTISIKVFNTSVLLHFNIIFSFSAVLFRRGKKRKKKRKAEGFFAVGFGFSCSSLGLLSSLLRLVPVLVLVLCLGPRLVVI